jgi:hypothetical protein
VEVAPVQTAVRWEPIQLPIAETVEPVAAPWVHPGIVVRVIDESLQCCGRKGVVFKTDVFVAVVEMQTKAKETIRID